MKIGAFEVTEELEIVLEEHPELTEDVLFAWLKDNGKQKYFAVVSTPDLYKALMLVCEAKEALLRIIGEV